VQGTAFDECHDQNQALAVKQNLVELHDARVLEPRHCFGLDLQPRSGLALRRCAWQEPLDRDLSPKPRIASAVDNAQAAATQFAENLVVVYLLHG
jgi:hypothetical protein